MITDCFQLNQSTVFCLAFTRWATEIYKTSDNGSSWLKVFNPDSTGFYFIVMIFVLLMMKMVLSLEE